MSRYSDNVRSLYETYPRLGADSDEQESTKHAHVEEIDPNGVQEQERTLLH